MNFMDFQPEARIQHWLVNSCWARIRPEGKWTEAMLSFEGQIPAGYLVGYPARYIWPNIQRDIWPDIQPDIQRDIWPDIWLDIWPDIWPDIQSDM